MFLASCDARTIIATRRFPHIFLGSLGDVFLAYGGGRTKRHHPKVLVWVGLCRALLALLFLEVNE